MKLPWRLFFQRRMIVNLFFGFSSGLPLLLVGSTLQAWMTDQKVDLTVIGFFSLVGLPYTVKFLWSPIFDRYHLPFLGRRRGWLAVIQIFLAIAIAFLGLSNPSESPKTVTVLAFAVAFFSASQDILVDAFRRDSLQESEIAMGTSLYVFGYRVAILVSGALALFMADRMPWENVYALMAGFVAIGFITTLVSRESVTQISEPKTLREAVIEPFRDYFSRPGAFGILGFILLYKLGDNMAVSMTTPFALSLGFSKTDLAGIAKTFGMIATISGGLAGGVIVARIGILRGLWLFGVLQAAAIMTYAVLALVGKNYAMLAAAVGSEYFFIGMATVAFTAFMASLTNKKFTATQYALLSSLMGIPRVVASAPTGWLALHLGWFGFFVLCTIIAIPGLFMLRKFPQLRS